VIQGGVHGYGNVSCGHWHFVGPHSGEWLSVCG